MKCLSIKQPYAALIVTGKKIYENRTWPTSHRGRLLIHAGKSRDCLGDPTLPDPEPVGMVFGAIVGYVDVVDCLPIADVPPDPYACGPWCFVLENAVASVPIPLVGKLGLFDVQINPEDLIPLR